MSRLVEKATPSVLQVNLSASLTCICFASDNQLTVNFLKEEKIDSRGQTILRKQQLLCNTAESETLKKYLSQLEYFQLYHVFTRENEKTEINPSTYAQVFSASANTTGRRDYGLHSN